MSFGAAPGRMTEFLTDTVDAAMMHVERAFQRAPVFAEGRMLSAVASRRDMFGDATPLSDWQVFVFRRKAYLAPVRYGARYWASEHDITHDGNVVRVSRRSVYVYAWLSRMLDFGGAKRAWTAIPGNAWPARNVEEALGKDVHGVAFNIAAVALEWWKQTVDANALDVLPKDNFGPWSSVQITEDTLEQLRIRLNWPAVFGTDADTVKPLSPEEGKWPAE